MKDERKKKKIWKTDSHISLGSTYMKFRKIPSTNYTDPIMIPFLHYKRHKHFNYFLKKKKKIPFFRLNDYIPMYIEKSKKNSMGSIVPSPRSILSSFRKRESSQNLHQGYFNSIEVGIKRNCKPLGY